MRFSDFVDALYAAGWRSPNDAQHTQIKELWRKLFLTGDMNMGKPPFVMSKYARREDLLADAAQYYEAECERLRAVLEKIANVDYRGNRSQESVMAYRALNDA